MIANSEHLSENTLDRLIEESISDVDRDRAESHLRECKRCGDRLTERVCHERWWKAASIYLSADGDERDTDFFPSDAAKTTELDQIIGILAPTDDPRMMGRVGSYEIVGVIGSGGMGIVLKGLDTALNRYVAIKLLRPVLAASVTARIRFAREGQATASVLHENVIAIHGVAEMVGLPYIVMPYVRGESLGARIAAEGPLKLEPILRIGYQVAAGLAAAHSQGLIHRDVKPSNILLEAGVERLKLTDFGLARAADDVALTQTGTIAGTPEYMSPEQAKGEVIDARSDLFSLGSVLWTMAVGRPPFAADSTYGVIRQIIETTPHPIRSINPALPKWFQTLVDTLMEKRADDRFASAQYTASLMERCLAHAQNEGSPLPSELRTSSRFSFSPVQLIGIGVLILLGTAAIASYSLLSTESESTNHVVQVETSDHSIEPQPESNREVDVWFDGTDASLRVVRKRLSRLRRDLD